MTKTMVESFTEGGPGHWLVFSSGAETILPLFLDLPEKKKDLFRTIQNWNALKSHLLF